MLEELFKFLSDLFGQENVALAYSDKVTREGFSCNFYEGGRDTDKNLDGTTNLIIATFYIDVWHNSMLEVSQVSDTLFNSMEGTKYQIMNITPIHTDGNKRKWYREFTVQVMEDV